MLQMKTQTVSVVPSTVHPTCPIVQQHHMPIRWYFTFPRRRYKVSLANNLRIVRRAKSLDNTKWRASEKQPVQRDTLVELNVNIESISDQVAICTTNQFALNQPATCQHIDSRETLQQLATGKSLCMQLTSAQLSFLLDLMVRFHVENDITSTSRQRLPSDNSTDKWLCCLKTNSRGLTRRNAMRRKHILDFNSGSKHKASIKSTELMLSSSLDDHHAAQSLQTYLENAPLVRNRWARDWAAMSNAERTLRETLYELLHTEKIFVTNLKQTIDHFVPHRIERLNYSHHALNRQLGPIEYVHLWANLRDIYQLHRCLYRKMLVSLDRQLLTSLGQILLHFFEQPTFVGHYRAYIANQPDQQTVLSTETLRPYRQTLHFTLITPVQRVMRYKLILENVLAAGERCKPWTVTVEETMRHVLAAYQAIRDVLEKNNRQARQLEQTVDGKLTSRQYRRYC